MKNGIALTNIHHPEGNPVPDDHEFNPDSLETIEIDIPMSIKELAEQAGFEIVESKGYWSHYEIELERFAELIRADEREAWSVQKFHLENDLEKAQDLLNEYMVKEALDKKADNARELGLDYEPDMSTKQQNVNTSEERVQISDKSIHEPVAWASTNDQVCALLRQAHDALAIASFPLKREWVGLTDAEIYKLWIGSPAETEDRFAFARAIEAKLREKNNGIS